MFQNGGLWRYQETIPVGWVEEEDGSGGRYVPFAVPASFGEELYNDGIEMSEERFREDAAKMQRYLNIYEEHLRYQRLEAKLLAQIEGGKEGGEERGEGHR